MGRRNSQHKESYGAEMPWEPREQCVEERDRASDATERPSKGRRGMGRGAMGTLVPQGPWSSPLQAQWSHRVKIQPGVGYSCVVHLMHVTHECLTH